MLRCIEVSRDITLLGYSPSASVPRTHSNFSMTANLLRSDPQKRLPLLHSFDSAGSAYAWAPSAAGKC